MANSQESNSTLQGSLQTVAVSQAPPQTDRITRWLLIAIGIYSALLDIGPHGASGSRGQVGRWWQRWFRRRQTLLPDTVCKRSGALLKPCCWEGRLFLVSLRHAAVMRPAVRVVLYLLKETARQI